MRLALCRGPAAGQNSANAAGVPTGLTFVYDAARVVDETRQAIATDALRSRRRVHRSPKGIGRARRTVLKTFRGFFARAKRCDLLCAETLGPSKLTAPHDARLAAPPRRHQVSSAARPNW